MEAAIILEMWESMDSPNPSDLIELSSKQANIFLAFKPYAWVSWAYGSFGSIVGLLGWVGLGLDPTQILY